MATKLIHITDIYHPHADPDDHYDLALAFAFSKMGCYEIEQVIIDHTQDERWGDPALYSVMQLNYLCKTNVQVTLGADTRIYKGNKNLWKNAEKCEVYAAEKIIDILKNADDKVYITIVGGSLDTSIAIERNPEIFKEKCSGIFLNAGSCEDTVTHQEHNVTLGRVEYKSILEAPCPVYWCPCMNSQHPDKTLWGKNATYHKVLNQKDMYNEAGDGLKNYFMYMLSKSTDGRFLRYMDKTPDVALLEQFGNMPREMWSTASFFEAAGKRIDLTGNFMNAEECKNPLYDFRTVKVSCKEDGETSWEFTDEETDRFIFNINNEQLYPECMAKAVSKAYKEAFNK